MPDSKSPVDLNIIVPFVEATTAVLETLANTKVERDKVFVRNADHLVGDISAIMAMSSDKYVGSMAIAFDEEAFLHVVSSMLGEPHTTVTEDIQDACGEIANQIFGHAKRVLNKMGHSIQKALPSVIYAKAHVIRHMAKGGPCFAVRFKLPKGTLTVEVTLKEVSPGP